MGRFFFTLLQILWGLPQSIVGFLLFLHYRRRARKHEVFRGAIVTRWSIRGSMSLGLFIFLSEASGSYVRDGTIVSGEDASRGVLVHEFGHSVQSLILGPLFLPLVGLPSFLWANVPRLRNLRRERRISYFSIYPENWANRLGEWATGLPSPGKSLPYRG
ncbi:MAG: hypothetical protein E7449_02430 [Ruminococcaceae bacterium]|nr:hypothetical protein [Oscillospiraceae bacterium]